jgi:hypothetical protein
LPFTPLPMPFCQLFPVLMLKELVGLKLSMDQIFFRYGACSPDNPLTLTCSRKSICLCSCQISTYQGLGPYAWQKLGLTYSRIPIDLKTIRPNLKGPSDQIRFPQKW